MSHVREQIRNAAATLVTGLTTTGSKVHTSRKAPLFDKSAELPCLCVYTGDEEIDEEKGRHAGLAYRYLELKITGYAEDSETLDDTLDDIAVEVETAVMASRRLGIGVIDTFLINSEKEETVEAEKALGKIDLIFKVTYLTAIGTPGTIIS